MNKIAISIVLIFMASGCATLNVPKQTQGTVAGGVLGAIVGSTIGDGSGQVIATAAGAIAGALIGSHIGKGLDERDQLAMRKATVNALEYSKSNSITNWSNPDSGNAGNVTPTRTFQMADGTYCREYTSKIEVAGSSETAYGTACRQADGSWKVAS